MCHAKPIDILKSAWGQNRSFSETFPGSKRIPRRRVSPRRWESEREDEVSPIIIHRRRQIELPERRATRGKIHNEDTLMKMKKIIFVSAVSLFFFYSPAGEKTRRVFFPPRSLAIFQRAVKAELTELENRMPDNWVQPLNVPQMF